MNFIAVHPIDRPDGHPPMVIATSAIVSLLPEGDDTWITLVTGEKFIVKEFASEILMTMNAFVKYATAVTRFDEAKGPETKY